MIGIKQRYEQARKDFIDIVREGNAICYDQALEEYKQASDNYYLTKYNMGVQNGFKRFKDKKR